MELASVLAGAPWSDRPGCTHPVLAAAARSVNDLTTDAGLPGLVPLVPLVVGTDDPDPGHATRLALFCLEWVSDIDSSHRSALDCSWLTAELLLEVAPPAAVEARHTRQARELNVTLSPTLDTYARRAAPKVAELVCQVIAETAEDSDAALRQFLEALLGFADDDLTRARAGLRPLLPHRTTPHPTKGGAGVRSQFLLGGGPASNP
jgi:hypothetical protein